MSDPVDEERPAPGNVRSVHEPEREGRQLALAAVFEADFGLRTAEAVLERRLAEGTTSDRAAAHARLLVSTVTRHRVTIDAEIERVAPAYPVVQLARIDRALLRCGVGELLHCAATPARVTISEWVELARTYSGEPTRRLMNGALGRLAVDASNVSDRERTEPPPTGNEPPPTGNTEGAPE